MTGSKGLIIPHSRSSFVGELRVNSSSANARARHRRPARLHHTQPLLSGLKTYLGFLSPSLCDSLLSHLFFHTKLHSSVQCQGSRRSRNIKKKKSDGRFKVQEINTENSTLVVLNFDPLVFSESKCLLSPNISISLCLINICSCISSTHFRMCALINLPLVCAFNLHIILKLTIVLDNLRIRTQQNKWFVM